MTHNVWPYIVSILAVVLGGAAIVFRKPITEFILRRQSSTFGRAADPLVKQGRPWNVVVAGAFAIVFGLLVLALALFVPPYHA
jgi:uncharacterized membrane protein HdeD (DUF308 family)